MIERIIKSNIKILHQCGQCDECVEILDHAHLKMHGTFSTEKVTFAKYLEHRISQDGRPV
jgi:polyferredoxin